MILSHIPRTFTRRMTMLYISVLCTLALLALLCQIVMQIELQQHLNDAHLINMASNQRMLSQEVSKTVLEIVTSTTAIDRAYRVNALKEILVEWQQVQNSLQHGDAKLGLSGKNSAEISHLFQVVTPSFTTIVRAGEQVIVLAVQNGTSGRISQKDDIHASVQIILNTDPKFLIAMESIVAQYEQEAVQHTALMQETELVLFLVTIFVLLFVGVVIFRPTVARITKDVTEIMHLEERVAYMTEVQRRNQAHERALHESQNALVTLNYPIQVLALGRYQVQDEHERTYLVTAQEHHVEQLRCECELYKRTLTCSHFVVASSLHALLLEREQSVEATN